MERETQLIQLCRVFVSDMPHGVNISPRPIVEQLLEKNKGDFGATLEDILNFDYDPPLLSPNSDEKLTIEKYHSPDEKSSKEKNTIEKNHSPYEKLTLEKNHPPDKKSSKEKNDEDMLQSIFGGDFTKSIISAVYTQNRGDVALTIDLLLNITNDEETIEAIRNMDELQTKQLEEDMKREHDLRFNERCLKLEKEIQLERSTIAQLETMGAQQQFVMKERLKEIEDTSGGQLLKPSEELFKLVHKEQEHNQHKQGDNQPGHYNIHEYGHTSPYGHTSQYGHNSHGHDNHAHIHNSHLHESSMEESVHKKNKQNIHIEHKHKEIVRMQEEIERTTEDHKKQIQQKKEDVAQKELFFSKLIQQAALCSLSVRYGRKTVIVSWSLGKDMKASPGDWIGFYKLGQPPQRYRQFIRTGGNRQDHHHFPAPKTPGLYHFKYFVNDSYNDIAESDIIHIGPRVTVTATLAENPTDERKNEIEVKYTLMEGEVSAYDWFGLYPASEKNNKNYLSYHKIGRLVHESYKVPELNSENFSSFRIPAPRTPGDYIIKFFPSQCGYTPITTSDTIRIPNKDLLSTVPTRDGTTDRIQSIHVTWNIFSVDISPNDYIALYRRDALNNNYEDYKYINPKSNSVTFDAPVKLGIYDFRYHSGNQSKYSDVVRSEPMEIVNTDLVVAHLEKNGEVSVSWNIDSQPKTTWDWVGIYRKGAPNKNYISCKYIQLTNSSLTFECPSEAGIYEARYFSSHIGKYTDFRRSNPFVVF